MYSKTRSQGWLLKPWLLFLVFSCLSVFLTRCKIQPSTLSRLQISGAAIGHLHNIVNEYPVASLSLTMQGKLFEKLTFLMFQGLCYVVNATYNGLFIICSPSHQACLNLALAQPSLSKLKGIKYIHLTSRAEGKQSLDRLACAGS